MPARSERAFWVAEPGRGEIRPMPARAAGPGEVLVRTRFSGISRGTERLVFAGRVPRSEHERMRAPFQEGDFGGAVKYGYLNVGVVEQGPAGLVGRTVFSLAPHQTASVLPVDAVVPVPEAVPARRAVLAGVVETALNALWDAPPLIGDAVAVVGAGLVGCCVARLAARHPGVRVTLIDVEPSRAAVADRLGVAFARPEDAPGGQDLAFHTSATADGLALALDALRAEGVVVDLSWYGDRPVELRLGAAFHSQRLTIRSSQVGRVAPSRRDARSSRDRLRIALDLLDDPAFDALLTSSSPFEDLPAVLAGLGDGPSRDVGRVVEYGGR